ncbi:MAG: glycosyltransferase family 4 protein [Calditrichaeota bacterium]|nr:MAG: glycosyltransferase family 4 protein [Calditrichota bacterium]
MPNKRILIFGHAESTHIYKWSTSLAKRGYQVRIVSFGTKEIEGVDVVTIPKKNKSSYFSSMFLAKKYALEFKPDIVHVHYAGGYGIWGLHTDIRPTLVSVWGSDINESAKKFPNNYFIKKLLSKAAFVTSTSDSLKSNTIELLPSVKEKIITIPFGVRIPETQFEFPDSKNPSAVYLKQLEPIYAPDLLIKATRKVVAKFPDFKLNIGGEGTMKQQLQDLIDSLKLNANVSIIGFYDNQKIYDLIKEQSFLVMPSLQEGFGVAAVEAFACSRPVVATNVGGIPEIVTDNQNGYLVEPNNVDALADAMIRMLSNRENMIKMGQNGYKVAKEKYDWEKSVAQMVELYEMY